MSTSMVAASPSAVAELVDLLDPESPVQSYSCTQCSRCSKFVPWAGSIPKICRSLTFGISLLKDMIFFVCIRRGIKKANCWSNFSTLLCVAIQVVLLIIYQYTEWLCLNTFKCNRFTGCGKSKFNFLLTMNRQYCLVHVPETGRWRI